MAQAKRQEMHQHESHSQSKHQHDRIEVVTRCADCGQELGHQSFNRADIEAQGMSELPKRQEMSLVNADLAVPINAALALNVLSDGSIAGAGATQNTPITQGAGGGSMLGGTSLPGL